MDTLPLRCYIGALVGTRRRWWGRYETVQRVACCLARSPAEAATQMRADLNGAWAGYQIRITVEELPPERLHYYAGRTGF